MKLVVTVIDLSAVFKSLFDVTAFINETQVFICDKSNFIINPQSIYKYVHSSSIMFRATPIKRYIHIYISLSHDCDMNLIGCFPMGTSIMYANTYITLLWL